jgi:hypothetical protein
MVRDDEPPLRSRISTGHPEVWHFPVADLGCLNKIIYVQPAADATISAIHDDTQQLAAHCFGSQDFSALRGSATVDILLCDIFSHGTELSSGGGYWPVGQNCNRACSRLCDTRHCGNVGSCHPSGAFYSSARAELSGRGAAVLLTSASRASARASRSSASARSLGADSSCWKVSASRRARVALARTSAAD